MHFSSPQTKFLYFFTTENYGECSQNVGLSFMNLVDESREFGIITITIYTQNKNKYSN